MMKLGKTVSAALVMSALLATIFACRKQEGPAERAGETHKQDPPSDIEGEGSDRVGSSYTRCVAEESEKFPRAAGNGVGSPLSSLAKEACYRARADMCHPTATK